MKSRFVYVKLPRSLAIEQVWFGEHLITNHVEFHMSEKLESISTEQLSRKRALISSYLQKGFWADKGFIIIIVLVKFVIKHEAFFYFVYKVSNSQLKHSAAPALFPPTLSSFSFSLH